MPAPAQDREQIHLGIDLIEIKRLAEALRRQGERFLNKVFTSKEIEYCRRRRRQMLPELAGRFAAKEAVMKALGTGRRGVAWREIEIVNNAAGKPLINLTGGARKAYDRLGGRQTEISLTHEKNVAAAVALIQTK